MYWSVLSACCPTMALVLCVFLLCCLDASSLFFSKAHSLMPICISLGWLLVLAGYSLFMFKI